MLFRKRAWVNGTISSTDAHSWYTGVEPTATSKMQVQADVDQSDIGQIHSGEVARFTVDAYPEQEFKGAITPSNKGKGGLAGTLGGKPLAAVLRRDPPDAGTPKPRA